MPFKFETMNIPKKYDRRIKLTPEDKDEIQYRYLHVGGVSLRELAREYSVDKRTIQFAIYPEKQAENVALRKAKGGSKQYYDKDMNTAAQKKHREYKKQLYKEGKLGENKSGEDGTK